MGDIDRIKRQHKFTKAVYKKLQDEDNMVKVVELVLKYNQNLKTNMSVKQLISFTKLSSEISPDNISYSLIPGTGRMIDKKSVWVPDQNKTEDLLKKYFNDYIAF